MLKRIRCFLARCFSPPIGEWDILVDGVRARRRLLDGSYEYRPLTINEAKEHQSVTAY
jgi:hypothetical protein